MKTKIITWLCCCFTMLGFGQTIDNIEYFFNSDPGFGGGYVLSASGGATDVINIDTSDKSLPLGFNHLYVRVQDNSNVWSMYDKRIFYITDFMPVIGATNITAAEYFFNSDPGFGGGNPITLGSFPLSFFIDTSLEGLPTGFNNLYIRVKDDLDVWSIYEKRIFYITDFMPTAGASSITAAEYFFNTDPGFGGGKSIPLGSFPLMFDIDTTSDDLTEGFNSLYIRTKDDLGVWSLYEKRIFYVEGTTDLTIPTIIGAEYFYDNDPGFGNAYAGSITPTGNPDEFIIDLGTSNEICDFHDFYLRLQNSDGTWSLYDYSINLEIYDNAPPTIVVFPNITAELNASGEASITLMDVDNGTFDDCELVSVVLNQTQFDYTCANLGANSVTITATDAEAKVSNQNVDITVVDLIEPVAVAKDITVQLDGSGNATITGAQIDNGSTDNCSVSNFSIDVSSFDCNDLGANIVTLTAIDQSGNNSTNAPTATVTIEDNVSPIVITQNITAQLDGSGNVSITAAQVDNGSTDNCTINNRSLDISAFTCANLGPNIVSLTVTDQSGNSDSNNATVTIEDSIDPIVNTQNIIVQLDGSGNVSIIAAQVDNGSTDNCTINNRSLDVSSFSCNDLGANVVTLTVTDQTGNTSMDTATITVQDNINPTAIGKDITRDLAGGSSITITANDVDNGSSDNCGFSLEIDVDTFNSVGVYPVILTITDSAGNVDTTTIMVTIEDSLSVEDFIISAKNIKLYPVPTEGIINISTKLIIDSMSIFDINGKHIEKIYNPQSQININELSSGIYFLKFYIENKSVTKHVLKE